MVDNQPKLHARNRRAAPELRGYYSTREYHQRTRTPFRTVQRWCADGQVPSPDGLRYLPVAGGDGRDYRIPLEAVGA